MRLSKDVQNVVLGNIELIKYCQNCGIDIKQLKKCNVERMGPHYVFGMPKKAAANSDNILKLDIDMDTQPDIVLIMTAENGKISFETTKHTTKVLDI